MTVPEKIKKGVCRGAELRHPLICSGVLIRSTCSVGKDIKGSAGREKANILRILGMVN